MSKRVYLLFFEKWFDVGVIYVCVISYFLIELYFFSFDDNIILEFLLKIVDYIDYSYCFFFISIVCYFILEGNEIVIVGFVVFKVLLWVIF